MWSAKGITADVQKYECARSKIWDKVRVYKKTNNNKIFRGQRFLNMAHDSHFESFYWLLFNDSIWQLEFQSLIVRAIRLYWYFIKNYLRVSTCRHLKGSSQLCPLTSRGERETTHTIQPLVWFQVWRNRRPQRKHWLDLGKLPLMVGSDGLNSRLAPSHKLLSSF